MNYFTRRQFLQSSLLTSAAVALASFKSSASKPLLSFSTLGCPDWSFKQAVDFAAKHDYNGLELRGIQHEMDLTKCNEFSAQNISATMQLMKDNNLHFVDLGSSCTLHFPESEERNKNLDEGKRFIDLAHKIDCPYIRVFPNNFLKERSKEATLELIIKGLRQLGDYAKGSNVRVLVESHGDLVYIADLKQVMQAAGNNTGMVWDITNMWTITAESPADMYTALQPYIFHTHIKDATKTGDKVDYKLLGMGDVPIFNAIDILYKNNYKGYYSFEWEKLWHPELAEPEVAFADYPVKMNKHFSQLK